MAERKLRSVLVRSCDIRPANLAVSICLVHLFELFANCREPITKPFHLVPKHGVVKYVYIYTCEKLVFTLVTRNRLRLTHFEIVFLFKNLWGRGANSLRFQ